MQHGIATRSASDSSRRIPVSCDTSSPCNAAKEAITGIIGRCVREATAARGLSKEDVDALARESKYGLEGWWARFWSDVEEADGHYLWRGAKSGGYGFVAFGAQGRKRKLLAHRVAFVYLYGDIAPGEDALHGCRHTDCVRHLRRGTQADNNADMLRDGTQVRGEQHGLSESSRRRAREIAARFDADAKATCASLAREFGVTLPTVYRAVHRLAMRTPVRGNARRA